MTNTDDELKIAVLQASSIPGDVEANLRAVDEAAGQAADRGIHLLVTPEMLLTGYNISDRVVELARQAPLERVREIAADHRVAIVASGPELLDGPDASAARVANSAWFFDETGAVLGRHRKIQLFGQLDRDMFVEGATPTTLVDYRGFRVALLICFDVEFPETVRAAALAGADLVAVPTAQMQPFGFVNDHLIRVRAWENGVYVAYANHYGTDGSLEYVGRSVIADPLGEHLAQAQPDGGALLTATMDREVLGVARRQSPYLTEVRSELFARPPAERHET
ncbi:carbon-nitrogen hydrolase family protein [Agromyces silvae]|uniref:carbon-nitrogen hydrolase family protein n=1 Tax=Agromyces silvae TaxID=3388266 RepID=UPI00280BD7D3|nr:carbon-nitrogen hydrolase family protein [Agromyces protaetiae]